MGNELSIQISVARETPDGEITETEGEKVISVGEVMEHVLVHETATEDLLAREAEPVFGGVVAGVARCVGRRNVAEIGG